MDTQFIVEIVGAAAAVVAVPVPIVLALVQRTKKGIGYEVLEIAPLIEKKGDGAEQLKIQFKGRVVEDPHLVRLRICNAGSTMISKKDFGGKPITVSFGEAKIFPFTPSQCKPAGLKPQLDWKTPHQLKIRPLDFYEGAELRIAVLVSHNIDEKDIKCESLVHGAKGGDARRLDSGALPFVRWIGFSIKWGVGLFGIGFLAWLFLTGLFDEGFVYGLLRIAMLVGFSLGFMAVVWLLRKVLDRSQWPDFFR